MHKASHRMATDKPKDWASWAWDLIYQWWTGKAGLWVKGPEIQSPDLPPCIYTLSGAWTIQVMSTRINIKKRIFGPVPLLAPGRPYQSSGFITSPVHTILVSLQVDKQVLQLQQAENQDTGLGAPGVTNLSYSPAYQLFFHQSLHVAVHFHSKTVKDCRRSAFKNT